ncbi:hypothetical protein BOX15_Mlig022930g1 [Macrostomum lignano]|uniref:Uncharacterized protein n=1 Tax=Macrostomum lignano TaxID=282301 RepID=A0A267FKE4_9PLAT|nr:hypothetical protein BOX15_Mlig022930g1 [Macrostomum lignano]
MPIGRYKHVASRFQQRRTLPPDCKSWIEQRDEEPSEEPSASTPNASAATAAAATGSGRMGGDLPENVTEERLYQTRLYDLALERKKMMNESDYVRNQFIDHQVRKARSKSLGRLLQGMDIEQYRNKSASGVEKLHQRSVHAKLMILANRRLGLSIDEVSKFTEAELRSRLNLPLPQDEATNPSPAALATTNLPTVHEQQQQPLRPSTSRTHIRGSVGWADQPPAFASRPGSHRLGSNAFAPASALSLGLPGVTSAGNNRSYRHQSSSYMARGSIASGAPSGYGGQSSTQDRRPRTASARRRVQSDPRCVQLINTLTPRYRPANKPQDVSAIIKANPSLKRSSDDEAQQHSEPQQHRQQKTVKGRRTRREALEMLDYIVRTRYYDAGNLASLS